MELTADERRMLDGGDGEGTALAMKILVGIGEAFRARRFAGISRAHVALSNQEGDLWFAEKLAAQGARCRVPPTVNPGFCLAVFPAEGMATPEETAMMQRTFQAYRTLGARLSFSCTPYLFDNIPRLGEIVAFSESSATPYVNSVWGARSNREAAQSALCAAVTGVTPEYGLLQAANRKATVVVEVDADLADDFAYQLLGWVVPKKIAHRIPAFVGIPGDVSPEALMNLGAQLNTSGAVPMYHIIGVTPEAPTLDAACQGQAPETAIRIRQGDLDAQLEELSASPGPIDFVMFGCPHFTIRQVERVAQRLRGQRLKTEMWILTSAYTLNLARRMGLQEAIEAAGGRIVADTCVDQPCWKHLAGKTGATDSPKCAYYCHRRDLRFVLRSLDGCVRAALKGRVE